MKDEDVMEAAERIGRVLKVEADGYDHLDAVHAVYGPRGYREHSPSDDRRAVIDAHMDAITPRPLDDWHEDDGFALWWKFPVHEPPYVGNPHCENWSGYHTHWTPIPMPMTPKEKS